MRGVGVLKIRQAVLAVLLAIGLLFIGTTVSVAGGVALFQTEQSAAAHCPKDVVVWVNTQTGVFHFKGQRWYAATRQGAFVCEAEALQGGMRATRNGQ
ncbi:hypothetical protein [Nitrospirillum pindoramense]|uniref:Uncharacterized protein n=1 Tax=Nitrospirillum amazonense TaxID=28077 RepID=A0A560H8H7_9PROT|nr:hypothetical protein [Nitrospirillum amazonense]TWB42606.1 hypothetical protein FBZ90_106206 [Nitrospirillum amazonense]